MQRGSTLYDRKRGRNLSRHPKIFVFWYLLQARGSGTARRHTVFVLIISQIRLSVKSWWSFAKKEDQKVCQAHFSACKTVDKTKKLWYNTRVCIGMSPSGKARDFDSRIRRFKSGHPSQQKAPAVGRCFLQLNPPPAGEIHLRWMKSLRDEIPLRGDRRGGFNFI